MAPLALTDPISMLYYYTVRATACVLLSYSEDMCSLWLLVLHFKLLSLLLLLLYTTVMLDSMRNSSSSCSASEPLAKAYEGSSAPLGMKPTFITSRG